MTRRWRQRSRSDFPRYVGNLRWADISAPNHIEWVDDDLHASGIRELERSKKRHVSFVDHISFLVMWRRGVTVAFAFDPDFGSAGFELFDA